MPSNIPARWAEGRHASPHEYLAAASVYDANEPSHQPKEAVVSEPDLRAIYLMYIDCLNSRDWMSLGRFVDDDVTHNGRPIGLSGYRDMLEQDVREIPDLRFHIELLVIEAPVVASRLRFDCSPTSVFLGLQIDGKRITFAENVFYTFRGEKIADVWSVIDKGAIEAQL
jgi:predicted ester cyclase